MDELFHCFDDGKTRVLGELGEDWVVWTAGDNPLIQTCRECFDERTREHGKCFDNECDCWCMLGKHWPIWALFGLKGPEGSPYRMTLTDEAQEETPQPAPKSHRFGPKLLLPVAGTVLAILALVVLATDTPRQVSSGTAVPAPETSPASHEVVIGEDRPDEDAATSGLDAGTVLAKLATKALPMPKGPAVQGQLAAPCPSTMEEINGYCWSRLSLTPSQVKDGACDGLGLYEPSDGWCRAHNAGYRPFRAIRRKNNTVEPE